MKIHSKFNDYYDSAMAHGVDDHLHWIRNVEEINLATPAGSWSKERGLAEKYPFFVTDIYKEAPVPLQTRPNWNSNWALKFVGVCGKIYPVYEYMKYNSHQDNEYFYAYTVDDVVKVITACEPEKLKMFMRKQTKKTIWFSREEFVYGTVCRYLDKYSGSDLFDEYFVEHNTPVFVIDPDAQKSGKARKAVLYLNAELKPLAFAKVMDPYTAYQEIEMYMSGILGLTEPDIVNVQDRYLAESKGFDKWSFKTMPTKRKIK
jgi:hypothetical protein